MIRSRKLTLAGLALGLLTLTGAGYRIAESHWHAAVGSTVTASMATSQTSTLDLGAASYSPTTSYTLRLTDGTGNNQFKIVYADTNRLAASDSILIDLNGTTPDAFGTSIACTTMKGIMVTADSANTNDVVVGGATVAAVNFLGSVAGDTIRAVPVGPGGIFLTLRPKTGTTVTGGSRDIVRIKNGGGTTSVKYIAQILCR